MKTKFRDIVIIVTVALVAVIGFFMFNNTFKKTTYDYSIIKYNNEIVAIVHFEREEVEIVLMYEENYPKVNLEENTITLLGKKQKDKRHELVIQYNFKKRSMKIVEEVSPKGICSNLGTSTSFPLICEPNDIFIQFYNYGDDVLDGII